MKSCSLSDPVNQSAARDIRVNKAIKLVSVRSKIGFGGAGSPRTSHPVVRSHFLVHTAGGLVLNVEFGAEVLTVLSVCGEL